MLDIFGFSLSIYTLLYNVLFIPIAKIIVFVLSIFNKKVKDRESNFIDSLQSVLILDKTKKNILFHASSMGEFEQAKPIIERLKKERNDVNIICSFYSPSGYNNQKNYIYADALVYMPFDSKKNAKYFFDKINPKLVVFIRYDIWHNHLIELNKRNTPVWLIDASEPGNKLLKSFPLWGFTKLNYSLFDIIYTLSDNDFKFFKNINLHNEVIKSTDTRFDRIIEKVENAKEQEIFPSNIFCKDDFVLVAGSTWYEDETVIINTLGKLKFDKKNVRIIFVPHEPIKEHIKKLKNKIPDALIYSEFIDKIPENLDNGYKCGHHIIIDKIGLLLNLYSYADAAYVGGGFGTGVHSVTEPAGYSIPVSAGPGISNSPDAVNLKEIGALEIIHNNKELYNWLRSIILYEDQRQKYGELCGNFVYKSRGSSAIIVNRINDLFKNPE